MFDMVTVDVGEFGISYPVYEAVLRKSSKFFDNAMKPEWASSRADSRVVDLSDEKSDIFGIYVHWLYFKTLPIVLSTSIEKGTNPEWNTLFKCYVLGDKIMDSGFKNTIMRAVADAKENQPFYPSLVPGVEHVRIIYDGTSDKAPARRLLVDMWVKYADENWLKHVNKQLPHDFILDFSRA